MEDIMNSRKNSMIAVTSSHRESCAMRNGWVQVTALSIAAMLAIPARAGQTAYEGFDLTFPTFSTGTGFSGPWAIGGFNVVAGGYTANPQSLSYSAGEEGEGHLATSGGSISGGAFSAINGALRHLAAPLRADNTTAYISFLIKPTGTLNSGIFNGFFGVTLNGSLGSDLFIGKPGAGVENEWVLETRGGGGQVASGVSTIIGKTVLLVVKAQFLAGKDTFTLYVDPKLGSPEPTTGVAKSDLDLGTVSMIGIYSSGAFSIDEIRLGTTYSDVTPRATGNQQD
jgi:hypothetical protein